MEEDYRAWLLRGLAKPGKSQSGLARHLGISQSAANRLAKGPTKIGAEDLPKIAAYIEEPIPGTSGQSVPQIHPGSDEQMHVVPLLGLVLDGIWIEATVRSKASAVIVPHPDYPVEAHYALEVGRRPSDGGNIDRRLYSCVKIAAVERKLRLRDLVHLEADRAGSLQWQIREIARRNGVLVLVPPGAVNADDGIPLVMEQVKGLVIGETALFRA